MPKATRWEVTGHRPTPPPRKLGQVAYDDVVHLVQGWVVFDTETYPFNPLMKPAGVAQTTYEETLCGIKFPDGQTMQRTKHPATCVACIASNLSHPSDVIEP